MKVTLVDWPRDLIGTFSKVWAMSKTNGDWENAEPDEEEFRRILDAEVPVLRFANFVFIIEDMPVFFREQLVRAKHEDFWIQSMRVADFRDAVPMYPLPIEPECEVVEGAIYDAYTSLLNKGYPEEVARRILPLATLHRGAWFTNLQALLTRFQKRSCWVAEDLWVGVLRDVRRELITKVHPALSHIATPPCYRRGSDRYAGCTINEIMKHRHEGQDPLPLCPLWGHQHLHPTDAEYHVDTEVEERADLFAQLWGRNPYNGAIVSEGDDSGRHGDDGS